MRTGGPNRPLGRVAPDRFEVTLLLLLLAAKGAGWLSLDGLAARWASTGLRMRDHAAEAVPHVVVVGGGFGGIAAVRALRSTACRITLIDRCNHYLGTAASLGGEGQRGIFASVV